MRRGRGVVGAPASGSDVPTWSATGSGRSIDCEPPCWGELAAGSRRANWALYFPVSVEGLRHLMGDDAETPRDTVPWGRFRAESAERILAAIDAQWPELYRRLAAQARPRPESLMATAIYDRLPTRIAAGKIAVIGDAAQVASPVTDSGRRLRYRTRYRWVGYSSRRPMTCGKPSPPTRTRGWLRSRTWLLPVEPGRTVPGFRMCPSERTHRARQSRVGRDGRSSQRHRRAIGAPSRATDGEQLKASGSTPPRRTGNWSRPDRDQTRLPADHVAQRVVTLSSSPRGPASQPCRWR